MGEKNHRNKAFLETLDKLALYGLIVQKSADRFRLAGIKCVEIWAYCKEPILLHNTVKRD